MENNINKAAQTDTEYNGSSADTSAILNQLVDMQKKKNLAVYIITATTSVIAVILLICSVIIIPKTAATLNKVNEVADHAKTTIIKIEEVADGISTVLEDNTASVTEALSKVNEIDIESLNESILSFSEILKPVADFFGIFKK